MKVLANIKKRLMETADEIPKWWQAMSKEEREAYIKEHPSSNLKQHMTAAVLSRK